MSGRARLQSRRIEDGSAAALAAEGAREHMTTATESQPAQAPAKGILVTEKALAKVRIAMAKEGVSPEQGGLRLGVQGGGCSGLSYNVRFDTQPRERDRIFQFSDVRVFVDPKSFIYLHGMTLDYQETLMQQGFVFVNPQASKSCGCGTSFSA
jgi:iron-sulfur cluster assembly protein